MKSQEEDIIEYYKQDLAIAQEMGDRENEGCALSNLGMVYRSLGEIEIAAIYLLQSLAIFQEINSPRVNLVQHWLDDLPSDKKATSSKNSLRSIISNLRNKNRTNG